MQDGHHSEGDQLIDPCRIALCAHETTICVLESGTGQGEEAVEQDGIRDRADEQKVLKDRGCHTLREQVLYRRLLGRVHQLQMMAFIVMIISIRHQRHLMTHLLQSKMVLPAYIDIIAKVGHACHFSHIMCSI